MKVSKVDLSHLLAVSHDGENLGLVIDRGNSLELVEIPAPVAAYEGLRQLNAIVASDTAAFTADFNQLPGVNSAPPLLPIQSTAQSTAQSTTQFTTQSTIQSTMAKAVGYDPKRNVLQVEFNNGSVYQYEGVDTDTWHELQEADSLGQFFNCEIRGNYPSRRLSR